MINNFVNVGNYYHKNILGRLFFKFLLACDFVIEYRPILAKLMHYPVSLLQRNCLRMKTLSLLRLNKMSGRCHPTLASHKGGCSEDDRRRSQVRASCGSCQHRVKLCNACQLGGHTKTAKDQNIEARKTKISNTLYQNIYDYIPKYRRILIQNI